MNRSAVKAEYTNRKASVPGQAEVASKSGAGQRENSSASPRSTKKHLSESNRPTDSGLWLHRRLTAFLLTGFSLMACCLMFPPVNWGWLGYVCLAPWLVCVCTFPRARFMYLLSWLLGFGYLAINIRWMIPVTIPGYLALSFYNSLFFPLAAWPIRHLCRRHGMSVALTAAIVWTAAEYARTTGELAFPWLLLAHTQYKYLTMIQISDLVGVCGVTFMVAMANGWLVDFAMNRASSLRFRRVRPLPLGTACLALTLIGTIGYGWVQGSAREFIPGPRVAVIQNDFPMYPDERQWRTDAELFYKSYLALGEKAAAEKPDLIVFPETAMTGYINDEFINATPGQLDEIRQRRFPSSSREALLSYQSSSRAYRDEFQRLANSSHASIVLGSTAIEWKPTAIPARAEAYNSSFLLIPGRAKPESRYDKNHLVLFGEYVPFRYSYHWLYQWLNGISPFGGVDYSLGAGSGFEAFEFRAASRGDQPYRAGTPICYEEIMPYIGREFARPRADGRAKNIDMLLSISNDGWFLHTSELEQHLAGGIFRSVENRVGMARSVNTGASSFVEPNGRIVDRVTLPSERIALLSPIEAALVKTQAVCGVMHISQPPDRTDLNAALADLQVQLARLGKEFAFMHERLARMSWKLGWQDASERQHGLTVLQEQVNDDIDTVRRWRSRPDTAPGYRVAEIKCDPRITLYARRGDWFAQAAVVMTGCILLDWLIRQIWRKPMDAGQEVQHV